MANLQDIFAGVNGVNTTYKYENEDIAHARMEGKYVDGKNVEHKIDISVAHDPAPAGAYKYEGTSKLLDIWIMQDTGQPTSLRGSIWAVVLTLLLSSS